MRALGALPELRDQPVPDCEGRTKGNLLSADRGDERLERVRSERWAEARESVREALENGVCGGESGEGLQIEVGAEQRARNGLDLAVERLDADALTRRGNPSLTAGHDPKEGVILPEVREVEPERAKALRREAEVVRLRKS